jgi:hypothetical protein
MDCWPVACSLITLLADMHTSVTSTALNDVKLNPAISTNVDRLWETSIIFNNDGCSTARNGPLKYKAKTFVNRYIMIFDPIFYKCIFPSAYCYVIGEDRQSIE